MTLYDKIKATATFISEKIKSKPQIAIILGSGLGGLTESVKPETVIDYTEIPGFPVSTVKGHGGKLIFGKLSGRDVMLMAGRFHYYEGYNMQEVTFPVRVMRALGVETLILSNASGGTNPGFAIGDLMILKDHINLFPEHPLRGPNDERLGTRFPDMGQVYDHHLIGLARAIAMEKDITVRQGVYVGLQGPSFETPSEYKWLHIIGGDAVGMSTVPEAIVARHGGMRVFAMSVITDLGITDEPVVITHEEVLEAANIAAPKMATIIAELVGRM